MAQGFLISEGLHARIKETIATVSGLAFDNTDGGPVTRIADGIPAHSPRLKRGTFNGSWAVNSQKTVTIVGSTNTVSVTNYCVGVTQSTGATSAVIFTTVMGTITAVEIQAATSTSTCIITLAGVDLTTLPGYSAGVIQLLGHSAADLSTNATACATLTWYSVTTCGTTT
jgi:hypothetical protein